MGKKYHKSQGNLSVWKSRNHASPFYVERVDGLKGGHKSILYFHWDGAEQIHFML